MGRPRSVRIFIVCLNSVIICYIFFRNNYSDDVVFRPESIHFLFVFLSCFLHSIVVLYHFFSIYYCCYLQNIVNYHSHLLKHVFTDFYLQSNDVLPSLSPPPPHLSQYFLFFYLNENNDLS